MENLKISKSILGKHKSEISKIFWTLGTMETDKRNVRLTNGLFFISQEIPSEQDDQTFEQ